MNLPRPRNSAATRRSVHLYPTPAPSTPHLVFAKKVNFSVTRGKRFPQTEGGSVSPHTHRQTPAVWMMLSQVKGPHAYSAEEIFVSEESRQFLLVRKDTGRGSPFSHWPEKEAQHKQRPLPWPSAERKDVVNLLLPKTLATSALTLRNQSHRNRLFCRNWELYTRDSRHWEACRLSYLPRTFALTFQRCFRCAGTAVNFFPAQFFPNRLPWTVLCSRSS